MLFRKHVEPRCAYCEKAVPVNEREMACVKRGIVAVEECCAAFRYDPLKRVPPRPAELNTQQFKEEDFTL